ncbi:MAG: hypothetical protein DCC49_11255 [Acidobacteria bacterium]|nr:MAG: hypothetical protein DCC49_11255 [Acidobacteriota bacterium]
MTSRSSLSHLEGHEFQPTEFEVTKEKIGQFADAIGDQSYESGEVAPPTMAALYGLSAVGSLLALEEVSPHLARVIHADQELTWERPVTAGELLTTKGRISRVRERSGAWFVTVESETCDSSGAPVGTSVSTLVIGGSE